MQNCIYPVNEDLASSPTCFGKVMLVVEGEKHSIANLHVNKRGKIEFEPTILSIRNETESDDTVFCLLNTFIIHLHISHPKMQLKGPA